MATLGANVVTLLDHAKRLDPNGKIADIVELLGQSNGLLQDMHWEEGNLPTGNRCTIRTGLPTVYWRLLNQGVQKSKSTTAQVDDAAGILEARSEVDVDIASLAGDLSAFRLSEAAPFMEAMNQEMESTVLYGNSSTAPEEFNGLAVRYADLSAANGQNIVDGGGSGADNCSIYLIVWGPQTVYGFFPKGSQAGLMHKDLGEGDAFDSSNNRFRAYMDQWQWKCGITVKDWRYCVRIANIDISNLVANAGSEANLTNLMVKAIHRLPRGYAGTKAGKPVFYMNRTCFQMLDIQRLDDVRAAGMTYADVDGEMRPVFRGVPIVISDSLLETEAQVS